MFTGTPEEARHLQEKAQAHAQIIADLLNRTDALGIGDAYGELTVPGARIRRGPEGTWLADLRS